MMLASQSHCTKDTHAAGYYEHELNLTLAPVLKFDPIFPNIVRLS